MIAGTDDLAWNLNSPALTTTAPDVTANNDGLALAAAGYPPASSFAPPLSPLLAMLFSVNGTAGTPGFPTIPALSKPALLMAALLLAAAGLAGCRIHPVEP